MLEMFDCAVIEKFVRPENRRIVLAHYEIAKLVEMMERWVPVNVEKWLDASTR